MAEGVVHSFGQFLATVEDGELHGDLTNEVEDIIATLNQRFIDGDRSKLVAKLNVVLKFSLDHKSGTVDVDADYTVVKPKKSRGRSVYWTTADNKLSRTNPRQMAMQFRDVAGDTAIEA